MTTCPEEGLFNAEVHVMPAAATPAGHASSRMRAMRSVDDLT